MVCEYLSDLVIVILVSVGEYFFFFNDAATTEIYTLSLHDALPICRSARRQATSAARCDVSRVRSSRLVRLGPDRKSTRLNSSHGYISYAVICLKKKNKNSHPCQQKKNQRSVAEPIPRTLTPH